MTEDGKAHSNSVPEGGITNKAYLNRGEEKEKNEEGKDKGQKGSFEEESFQSLSSKIEIR